MKRTKMYLAATAALLAFVGILTTKAHKAFAMRQFFTGNSGFCEKITTGPVQLELHGAVVGNTIQGCIGANVFHE